MRWSWLVVLCACAGGSTTRCATRTASPKRWADGAIYCTPEHRDAVYSEATCSDAIAPASVPYVATYFTLAGVTWLRRLHPTTRSPRTIAQYWIQTANGCAGPYAAPPDATWATVGDELDETAFVRVLRSAPEGDGRLQTIAWHTSDGLHEPMGFHDRDLGADCTVRFEFGRDRDHVLCAPPAQPLYYYADTACTQPVVVVAPDEPSPIIQLGCETFARAGGERAGAVYASVAGSCQPTTVPDGSHQYDVGAAFEPPVVSRVRGGAGRIQAIELASGDLRVSDRYLHDTMLDADCEPVPGTDGLRCLPTYQNIDTYYRDDQCTQMIGVVSENVGTCEAPVQYASDAAGFHEVGALVTAPLFVPSTGDRCMAQLPPGEPHEVGPPLPVDTFVRAL